MEEKKLKGGYGEGALQAERGGNSKKRESLRREKIKKEALKTEGQRGAKLAKKKESSLRGAPKKYLAFYAPFVPPV